MYLFYILNMNFKLQFNYGTMNSSKTTQLLISAHNYENNGKKVLLIKPKIDSRFGENVVKSRIGIWREADIILDKNDKINFYQIEKKNIDVVFVDESQFLTSKQIEELRELTLYTNVICYGLKTDYKCQLFNGSKRLIELADTIKEIKTNCKFCTNNATINMKHIDGIPIKKGDSSPDLGCEEKYLPVCWKCWFYK